MPGCAATEMKALDESAAVTRSAIIPGRSRHSWSLRCARCGGRTRSGSEAQVFEMDGRGHSTVTRSTAYRVLVRSGLIEQKSRRRKRVYRRKMVDRWWRGIT